MNHMAPEISSDRNYAFTPEGDAFALNTIHPPRNWKNVHYSGFSRKGAYWSRCTQTGEGSIFLMDAEGNRCTLTPDAGRKVIYFRDDDTRTVWNIGGAPVPTAVQEFTCRYRLESTELSSIQNGIFASQRVFVPEGADFEIWTVQVENRSRETRRISIFPYLSLGLDGFKSNYAWGAWHKKVWGRADLPGCFAECVYPNPAPETYTAMLVASALPIGSLGGNSEVFTAGYSYGWPNLVDGRDFTWTDTTHDEEGLCLMLQNRARLAPGDSIRIHYAVGRGGTPQRAQSLAAQLTDAQVEAWLDVVREREKRHANVATIDTGNERVDRFFNHWLKKQIHTYLVFKTGIRDNLQTNLAFASIDPESTRENLEMILSHQYADGHFPHTAMPLNEHHYGDKTTWCLLAVPAWIRETGEITFLEKELPFLIPGGGFTQERGTVLDHLLRAREHIMRDTGQHGLPLIHQADWNDDLTGPGLGGGGESVLTAMMFCRGLLDCVELFEFCGKKDLAQAFQATYADFKDRINATAWDGEWYLRAFAGDGTAVGSHRSREGQIYTNVQTWAALGKIADEERSQSMFAAMDRRLETKIGMKVLDPLYTEWDPAVGDLSVALPGYYVNGVYNHAGAFKVLADCEQKRGAAAWRMIEALIPDSPANPSEQSLCEPFSITNCYRCDELRYGLCGDVWHSGTSAWLYVGIVEGICGLRPHFNGLQIRPCLPPHLNRIAIRRTFQGCDYHFVIEKDNQSTSMTCRVDGEMLDSLFIPHRDGRIRCDVVIRVSAS